MTTKAQRQRNKSLAPRTTPTQKRSIARREQILDVAAELLEKLGTNTLTTIRIAEEVGISVGTLYHYFPNKEAILHAMGQHWLAQMVGAFNEQPNQQQEGISGFVNQFVSLMLNLYRQQKGLLHLVQGMFAIPQLMPLDAQHDELVIQYVHQHLANFGIHCAESEGQRIARTFHEISHALLLVAVHQNPDRAAKTLTELRLLLRTLLHSYQAPTA